MLDRIKVPTGGDSFCPAGVHIAAMLFTLSSWGNPNFLYLLDVLASTGSKATIAKELILEQHLQMDTMDQNLQLAVF